MTAKKLLTGLSVLLISLLIISCNKEKGNPTIKFVTGPQFTGKDTVMKVNHALTVILEVTWNGTDLLKQLEVKQNAMLVQTFAMGGDSATFNLNIVKGADATEKWSFAIVDVKDNRSEISLTLTKDPNSEFGAIKYYSPVVLGAQNNTIKAAFISFQTDPATLYNLSQVQSEQNRAKIDLTYYSDGVTNATLAAPGSAIPADVYPAGWSMTTWVTRNVSKFIKTGMTLQDFDAITNDAPIVNAWIESKSVSLAGDLKVNDIWLVKLQSGKKGVILIKRIVTGNDGEMEFGIKIQQ